MPRSRKPRTTTPASARSPSTSTECASTGKRMATILRHGCHGQRQSLAAARCHRPEFAAENLPGPFVRTGAAGRGSLAPVAGAACKGRGLAAGRQSVADYREVFRALAAAEGVDLPQPSPGVMPMEPRGGAPREHSAHDIARQVLHSSNNLSAELIGLAASLALTGRELSLAEFGQRASGVVAFASSDADWTGFHVENHSGLSSKSHATPRQIVVMLQEAAGSYVPLTREQPIPIRSKRPQFNSDALAASLATNQIAYLPMPAFGG